MVYITRINMSTAGAGHEHIANVRWNERSTGNTAVMPTAQMVAWIDNGGDACVSGPGSDAQVGTVAGSPKYLRTYADGQWNNNLLELPRF